MWLHRFYDLPSCGGEAFTMIQLNPLRTPAEIVSTPSTDGLAPPELERLFTEARRVPFSITTRHDLTLDDTLLMEAVKLFLTSMFSSDSKLLRRLKDENKSPGRCECSCLSRRLVDSTISVRGGA